MKFRQLRKANVRAVFDDRSTGAMKVDIHILALVHTELAAFDHHDGFLDSSNVCWPGD